MGIRKIKFSFIFSKKGLDLFFWGRRMLVLLGCIRRSFYISPTLNDRRDRRVAKQRPQLRQGPARPSHGGARQQHWPARLGQLGPLEPLRMHVPAMLGAAAAATHSRIATTLARTAGDRRTAQMLGEVAEVKSTGRQFRICRAVSGSRSPCWSVLTHALGLAGVDRRDKMGRARPPFGVHRSRRGFPYCWLL